MAALASFFPGLGPRDYWDLTGYERRALLEWRQEALSEEQRERRREIDKALAGR